MGGMKKIIASRYQIYSLQSIIDDDGKMIGCRHFLSRENGIAEELGLDILKPVLAKGALPTLIERQAPAFFMSMRKA